MAQTAFFKAILKQHFRMRVQHLQMKFKLKPCVFVWCKPVANASRANNRVRADCWGTILEQHFENFILHTKRSCFVSFAFAISSSAFFLFRLACSDSTFPVLPCNISIYCKKTQYQDTKQHFCVVAKPVANT